MLTAYKITCDNGYSWTTNMAAGVTLDDAKAYFIGQRFDTAPFPAGVMATAISVEAL